MSEIDSFRAVPRGEQNTPNAVRKAIASRSTPKLVTENLDTAYNDILRKKQDPSYYAAGLVQTYGQGYGAGGVRKFSSTGMKRTASGYSVDRVFSAPHNPFRNRLNIDTPTDLSENYRRFRYYFKHEPLVHTAIKLHAEFPLSEFRLRHEDPALAKEFNDISYKLNLFDFMLDMALEYWLIGECFPFGIFDDKDAPSMWKAFVLLNPLLVDVESVEITDGRPASTYRLRINEATKTIVKNGARDPRTGDLFNRIPQDIKDACAKDGFLKLNEKQVSHFKNKGNYFSKRGESILYTIIHLLNYRDKLRDAQYMIADRHTTPRELWKVGEADNPATEDELSALAGMIANSYDDPGQAIIFHHAVTCDVIGTADKVLPLRQELDGIEEEMLIGLMLNKGFLDSNYGAYANMSVALDVLISRYTTFRQRIERWQSEAVWAPICRIHDIYKPTAAELSHRIKIKNKEKQPWVPTVVWDKNEMKDNTQKINLMLQLRKELGRPGFPRGKIYQMANFDPEEIKRDLDKEGKEEALNKSNINLGGGGAPMMGGGAGGGLPDLNIDTNSIGGGGPTGENLNIPEDQLPEFNGQGKTDNLNSKVMPPASQSIQNDQSPT